MNFTAPDTIKWLTSLQVDLGSWLDNEYRYCRFTPIEATNTVLWIGRSSYATYEMRLHNGFVIYFNNEALLGERSRGNLLWSIQLVDENMAALGYTPLWGEQLFTKELSERSIKDIIINFLRTHIQWVTKEEISIRGDTLPTEPLPAVRTLEWVDNVAHTILGDFRVGSSSCGGSYWYSFSGARYNVKYHTVDDAKEAAEAHYMGLILGLLEGKVI